MVKFESGFTVETVFDGSKLGIEPHTVEVLPSGELLILDSANSNIYRISSSLSLCKWVLCGSWRLHLLFLDQFAVYIQFQITGLNWFSVEYVSSFDRLGLRSLMGLI